MQTYDVIPKKEEIGCYPDFGPVFLGCQIRVYDDAFSKGGSTFERGVIYMSEKKMIKINILYILPYMLIFF